MELRYTDTNSGDDSAGRAFGLDGDLYLPLVVAFMVAMGLAGLFGFLVRTGWVFAGVAGATPLLTVAAWIVLLKHGKPAGYDRDKLADLFGGGDFTRSPAEQERLA